ncbi:unnamed protein product [Caenorhabditis angaria]|uniref:G-protein coupled receptors family 1 profile domain-containing protein n=1 Tax=Caenorhabditis angaria TaxID=860376 RepID=A0A9P1INH7_9PELO|nr:unnamed protein product [Caenorhabditis angaria]
MNYCPQYFLPDLRAFRNCSGFFESDQEFCDHIKDLYDIELMTKWAVFVVPCVVCSISAVLDFFILIILFRNFRGLDESLKKRYIFLLSRCFSSFMSVIAIIFLPLTLLVSRFNFWFLVVFIVFDTLSFFTFIGAFMGFALTMYLAVIHPFFYRTTISYRKCKLMIISNWIVSLIVSIAGGIIQAAFMSSNPPFICDFSTCDRPMLIFSMIFVCIGFGFTMSLLLFVVCSLKGHERKMNKLNDISLSSNILTTRSIIRRLISTLIVFGLMASFEITISVMLFENAFNMDKFKYIPPSTSLPGLDEYPLYCDALIDSRQKWCIVLLCSILTLFWTIDTANQCFLITQVHLVAVILKWFNYYLCTFMFCLAGILNVYTISIIFPLFLKMTQRSQKRYVFVLSRLFSSIIAVFVLVVLRCILFVWFAPTAAGFWIMVFLVTLNDFSFYSLMGSYIGMAFIIYLGVCHPWYYENDVELRHIFYMAIGNVVTSLTVSIPTAFFAAGSYAMGPVKCDSDLCASILSWINFILTSFSFGITISILSYVLCLLFYYEYKARRIIGMSGLAHAKSKVGWTLFAICLIAFGEGIPSAFLLSVNADNVLSTCRNFYEADKLVIPTILSCLCTLIWSVVLLIDPFVSIISDDLVVREIQSQINWTRLLYAKLLNRQFSGK